VCDLNFANNTFVVSVGSGIKILFRFERKDRNKNSLLTNCGHTNHDFQLWSVAKYPSIAHSQF
jgi:hypothetical protein